MKHSGCYCRSTLILVLVLQAACVRLKKVGIIGCGVSGLGLAASLKILGSGVGNIVIYDAREDPLQSSLGGGLQLSSGAVILNWLGLLERLKESSNAITSLSSRNSRRESLLSVNITELAKTIAPQQVRSDEGRGDPMFYSVMRDQLLSILHEAVVMHGDEDDRTPRIKIVGKKKLVTIREDVVRRKVSLVFEDGSTDEDYDVVVGADGVNSIVRSYVSSSSKALFDAWKPKETVSATGLRIAYCVTPSTSSVGSTAVASTSSSSLIDESSTSEGLQRLRSDSLNSFHQWFGDGVYALIASYGAGLSSASDTTLPPTKAIQHMLAVVYRSSSSASIDRGSSILNADWQVSPKGSKAYIQKLLIESGLQDIPEITSMLDASFLPGGRSFDLGIRDSVVPLKKWSSSSGAVILIGDSAHPMSPFLGQGANQALQDAYCLATLMRSFNGNGSASRNGGGYRSRVDSLTDLTEAFERKRKLPTALVSAESSFLGRLETLGSPLGCLLKETVFRVLDRTGIAGLVYITGAIPRV